MPRFVDGPVRVSVPATSANLGPGFDALGLALALRDELEAEVVPGGVTVEVTGEGADDVPRDESHLVVRAMRAAFAVMGEQPPGLRLSCRNVIPHSRGLGSSSAAIVAGIALARGLVAGGGLLMDGTWYATRAAIDPRVSVVVFVPAEPVATSVARGLLPGQVPHADAAANAGRAALLVAALAGRPELLHLATRDLLHQDYRAPAMPASLALLHELRASGQPAVVSGAGPTVLVFTDGPVQPVADRATGPRELLARCPAGWSAHHLEVDTRGVVVSG